MDRGSRGSWISEKTTMMEKASEQRNSQQAEHTITHHSKAVSLHQHLSTGTTTMCFFASVQRESNLIESSVGPCQFCGSQGSVDLVQERAKWYLYGCFPTSVSIEELAICGRCRKSIKAVHYNLRVLKGGEGEGAGFKDVVEGEVQVPVAVGSPVMV